MKLHHDYYRGSIVVGFRNVNTPRTCQHCMRRRKEGGCQIWKKKGLGGTCSAFAFSRFASAGTPSSKAKSPKAGVKAKTWAKSKSKSSGNQVPSPDKHAKNAPKVLSGILGNARDIDDIKERVSRYCLEGKFALEERDGGFVVTIPNAHSFIRITSNGREVTVKRIETDTGREISAATAKLAGRDEPLKVDASIANDLAAAGFEYVDKRPSGGCLWVVGGICKREAISKVVNGRAEIHFCSGGGKASGGRDAWWIK